MICFQCGIFSGIKLYRKVRYLYKRSCVSYTMHELKQRNFQKQELLFRKPALRTSANLAECFVCGKGVSDGYSVTAKSIHGSIELFCSAHYRLQ